MNVSRTPSELPLVRAARRSGVRDSRVLGALATVRRAAYLPPALATTADADIALPVGWGQTTSQPSLIALMIEALAPGPDARVLEVGTGPGYEAAILAGLVASVHSVELVAELAELARANLTAEGVDNVVVHTADGTLGWPSDGPYDRVIVAAAGTRVPDALGDQLVEGGRLVQPIDDGRVRAVVVFEKRTGALHQLSVLCRASFVPLIGAERRRS